MPRGSTKAKATNKLREIEDQLGAGRISSRENDSSYLRKWLKIGWNTRKPMYEFRRGASMRATPKPL